MRIHHLNCISTCPLGGKLMDGTTRGIVKRGHLTCHCSLVETSAGLVLVDTGLGRRDVAEPRKRLSGFFLALLRPEFRDEMTAYRQIERLGLDPRDVRHIVLTHLDFDHAGGLDDFPDATVHMMAAERDYALLQRLGWIGSDFARNNGPRAISGACIRPVKAMAGLASNACGHWTDCRMASRWSR